MFLGLLLIDKIERAPTIPLTGICAILEVHTYGMIQLGTELFALISSLFLECDVVIGLETLSVVFDFAIQILERFFHAPFLVPLCTNKKYVHSL